MAIVEQCRLPDGMDGVCLDLKKIGKRPRIMVSNRMSTRRQRFTLAHEIGHIVIPWHNGAIIDDLSAPGPGEQTAYRRVEAEANRFASELLMPTDWVRTLIVRADHLGAVMQTVAYVADVSWQAALYKTLRTGPPGYIAAIVENDAIVEAEATRGSWAEPPAAGSAIDAIDMQHAFDPYVVTGDARRYYWWRLRDPAEGHEFNPELSALLESILASLPSARQAPARNSIEVIVSYALGGAGARASADQLLKACADATRNRQDRDAAVASISAHPRFEDYLRARVDEHVRANEYADMLSATYHGDDR